MKSDVPYVITISRQYGSGGALIGREVASQLGITYLDKDIVREAANRLHEKVKTVSIREEKKADSWIWRGFNDIGQFTPPSIKDARDFEIFTIESQIILEAAAEKSVLIVGRGGCHILKDHPRHLSIYIYADLDFRINRISETLKRNWKEALRLIEATDRSREKYIKIMTGLDMGDLKNYDIAFNTSAIGLETVEKLIVACANEKFGK